MPELPPSDQTIANRKVPWGKKIKKNQCSSLQTSVLMVKLIVPALKILPSIVHYFMEKRRDSIVEIKGTIKLLGGKCFSGKI